MPSRKPKRAVVVAVLIDLVRLHATGHPLKKKKHVHLYICDKHGKLHKRTVTKRRHGKGERKVNNITSSLFFIRSSTACSNDCTLPFD